MSKRRFFFDQLKAETNRLAKQQRQKQLRFAKGGLAMHFEDGGQVDNVSQKITATPGADAVLSSGRNGLQTLPQSSLDKGNNRIQTIHAATENLAARPTPSASSFDFEQMRKHVRESGANPAMQSSALAQLSVAEQAERTRAQQRAELQAQINAPDKWAEAERLFKVSAALARPSKTGGFGATLENLAEAGAGYGASKSAEEKAKKELRMKELELQGLDPKSAEALMKVSGSLKPDSVIEQEARVFYPNDPEKQRAYIDKQLKIKEKKEESAVEQEARILHPDDPAKQRAYIEKQFRLKEKKSEAEISKLTADAAKANAKSVNLSDSDIKDLKANDVKIDGMNSNITALDEALKLNEQAFGSYAEYKAHAARLVGEGIPILLPAEWKKQQQATATLQTKTIQRALLQLKTTFGANPTEGERKILLDLEGSINKSPVERAAVFKALKEQLKENVRLTEVHSNRIRSGAYSSSSARGSPQIADQDLIDQYLKDNPPPAANQSQPNRGKR